MVIRDTVSPSGCYLMVCLSYALGWSCVIVYISYPSATPLWAHWIACATVVCYAPQQERLVQHSTAGAVFCSQQTQTQIYTK